ncbi:MAG: hypothetical protein WCK40_01585 [Thermoleophilia bacterium]
MRCFHTFNSYLLSGCAASAQWQPQPDSVLDGRDSNLLTARVEVPYTAWSNGCSNATLTLTGSHYVRVNQVGERGCVRARLQGARQQNATATRQVFELVDNVVSIRVNNQVNQELQLTHKQWGSIAEDTRARNAGYALLNPLDGVGKYGGIRRFDSNSFVELDYRFVNSAGGRFNNRGVHARIRLNASGEDNASNPSTCEVIGSGAALNCAAPAISTSTDGITSVSLTVAG